MAWLDEGKFTFESDLSHLSPAWSPNRATQLKTRPSRLQSPTRLVRLLILTVNTGALAVVVYAVLATLRNSEGQDLDRLQQAVLTLSIITVVAFAILGMLMHASTFVWHQFKRWRHRSRPVSWAYAAGTVFVAWAGISGVLALVGNAQLQQSGSARLASTGTVGDSSVTEERPEDEVDNATWKGDVVNARGKRVGTISMVISGKEIEAVTVRLNVQPCPRKIELRDPTRMRNSDFSIKFGQDQDVAVFRGAATSTSIEGRLRIPSCGLDVRAIASPG